MKFISKIIKSLDFFGTLITFRINNDLEYKSLLGGISSIIFFIISSTYILYESYFFIKKENVDFIYSKKTIETPFLNLTKIGYKFAFGLQYEENDTSCILNTLKYFNYSISLIENIDNKIQIETPIKLKLCEKSDFRNIVNRTFERRQLDKMYCPIINNLNFTVDGTMMDYYYKYIILQIWLTEYTLNNYEEFKKFIEENPLEMSYYFLDNAIDYENRKNPLPFFLNYLFKAIDINYQKNTEIILSPIEFYNDENLIIKKNEKYLGSTIDNHVDSFHQINEPNYLNQRLLGKFILKASPIMFSLSRSYQKIPSLIADLSGILEQILFLILVIVNFFERKCIDIKLMKKMIKYKGNKYYNIEYLIDIFNRNHVNNKLYEIINKQDMDIEKNGNLGIKSRRKSLDNLLKEKNLFQNVKYLKIDNDKRNNLNITFQKKKILVNKNNDNYIKTDKIDYDNIYNNSNQNLNIHSYDKKFTNIIIESIDSCRKNNTINYYNTDLKLSFNEIKNLKNNYIKNISIFSVLFSKIFFCLNKNQKRKKIFFEKAEDKIHYYFDVYNYIKKMQDIDLLIYTLFDNDQFKLFDFLSIPPLKIDNNKNDIYNEFQNKQRLFHKYDYKIIDDLILSYNNIRKREETNFEDLKLMRLVNAEVKFFS